MLVMDVVYLSLDIFLCFFLMNTAARFQILRHELENLVIYVQDNSETFRHYKNINDTFKNIIKKHNVMINNVKGINFIFSTVSLLEVIFGSAILCAYAIQLLVNMFFNFYCTGESKNCLTKIIQNWHVFIFVKYYILCSVDMFLFILLNDFSAMVIT